MYTDLLTTKPGKENGVIIVVIIIYMSSLYKFWMIGQHFWIFIRHYHKCGTKASKIFT